MRQPVVSLSLCLFGPCPPSRLAGPLSHCLFVSLAPAPPPGSQDRCLIVSLSLWPPAPLPARRTVVSLSPCLFGPLPPSRLAGPLSHCLFVSLAPAPARRRLPYHYTTLMGTPAGAQGRGSSLAGGGSGFWHGGPAKLRRCLTVQGSIGGSSVTTSLR